MNPPTRAAKPFFAVKNWELLQHYGASRTTIWIKLYARLLDDVDFLDLPEVTQAHLVKLWLLAMRQTNKIPLRLDWIEKEIEAREPVDFALLITGGWLLPNGVKEEALDLALEEYRSRPRSASKLASVRR